ncbi:class I SAM-dependent methyltransferase [Calderihabitans maritimus]|uniref:Methyltransferase type 11 n=1 Tax=Calderihabitans maritimus TaxID=1246530 RepID=A0A1Z5HR54_9FIRM|nr:class I SAM-dependent methyltransferase [Calderihabitans maritimus]GAW91801.1 methyltransferase type 11 [Calderihabitans maritimus]
MKINSLTEKVKRKYNRFALIYDLLETPMETMMLNKWRAEVWQKARGKVLEVGVGTGRNMHFYPENIHVTAIDFSEQMLKRAERRRHQLGLEVDLLLMDVQELDFPDNTFDTAVATCVFCTVPDPVKGLAEVRRVVKPEGKIILLEHVRSCRPFWGRTMDWLDPIVYGLIGTHINRDTVRNVEKAGLQIHSIKQLWRDILLQIEASPGKTS